MRRLYVLLLVTVFTMIGCGGASDKPPSFGGIGFELMIVSKNGVWKLSDENKTVGAGIVPEKLLSLEAKQEVLSFSPDGLFVILAEQYERTRSKGYWMIRLSNGERQNLASDISTGSRSRFDDRGNEYSGFGNIGKGVPNGVMRGNLDSKYPGFRWGANPVLPRRRTLSGTTRFAG